MSMVYEEIRRLLMQGTTSDDVIKRELIRQVIYKEAALLSVGVLVVGAQEFDSLDIRYSFPTEIAGEYPVAENAPPGRVGTKAVDFDMSLQQGEVRYYITDPAKLRQLGNYQVEFSRRRAAEALAKLKDDNIIAALIAGKGNTAAATADWSTATAANIVTDVMKAVSKIMETSNIRETELGNMAVITPAKVWGYTLTPAEFENMRKSVQSYLKDTHGIVFLPTRYATTAAIVLIKGPSTCIHGVLRAAAPVPMVEETRIAGRGTEYLIRQWFNSKVVPDSDTVSTSSRIYTITGVTT